MRLMDSDSQHVCAGLSARSARCRSEEPTELPHAAIRVGRSPGTPAYMLGRPAGTWMKAMNRRRTGATKAGTGEQRVLAGAKQG
jgi:hypothetical protein